MKSIQVATILLAALMHSGIMQTAEAQITEAQTAEIQSAETQIDGSQNIETKYRFKADSTWSDWNFRIAPNFWPVALKGEIYRPPTLVDST